VYHIQSGYDEFRMQNSYDEIPIRRSDEMKIDGYRIDNRFRRYQEWQKLRMRRSDEFCMRSGDFQRVVSNYSEFRLLETNFEFR